MFVLFLVLTIMGLVLLLSSNNAEAGNKSHGPIDINGDAGFNTTNGVVSGNGTSVDPYLIEGWSIDASAGNAVTISNTDKHFVLRDITLHGDDARGELIRLQEVKNASLEYVDSSCHETKIYISGCDGISITNVTITGSYGSVYIGYTSNAVVSDIDLDNAGGFLLRTSEDCVLFRCNGTYFSIIQSSDRTQIIECNASSSVSALTISQSDSCIIRDSILDSHTFGYFDVQLDGSYHTMKGCQIGERGVNLTAHGYHDLGLTNTVGNKTLHYYLNQSNIRVDKDAGQVFFIGCTNVTVADLTFDTVYTPITLWGTKRITLENLTLGGFFFSVYAGACHDFVVRDNVIVKDELWSQSTSGYFFTYVTDLKMEDVLIEPGFGFGVYIGYTSYIRHRQGDLRFSNVTILGAESTGIIMGDCVFQNITIDRCLINGTDIGIDISRHRTLSITNTIFTNCSRGIELSSRLNQVGYNASISNNYFYLL